MKQIPLRNFQLKANDYLGELPLELTKYGRVVAIVHSPQESEKVVEVKAKLKQIVSGASGGVNYLARMERNISICHHGADFGNCKHGCRLGKEVK